MTNRGEHLVLQMKYPSTVVTYLINCSNGSEGFVVTHDGTMIDLKDDAAWVTMSEHLDRIVQCSGFVIIKNGEPLFIQTDAHYLPKTGIIEKQMKFFNDLVIKSPAVTYCQLKEKLLNKKKSTNYRSL